MTDTTNSGPFTASTNNVGEDWVQLTISGEGINDLDDGRIERVVERAFNERSTLPPFQRSGGSQASLDVLAERFRQVAAENFDASHDDMATRGQLALAAVSYAYEASRTDHQRRVDAGDPPRMWPWEKEWWKPTDRRRDLVKAAALIIAEIERLDRAALASEVSDNAD